MDIHTGKYTRKQNIQTERDTLSKIYIRPNTKRQTKRYEQRMTQKNS